MGICFSDNNYWISIFIYTMTNKDLDFYQQKIHLAVDFLTENNVSTLHSGLSNNTISQVTQKIKHLYVDLTGIEPANSDFSDPNVYQHQAHTSLSLSNYWTRNNTEVI